MQPTKFLLLSLGCLILWISGTQSSRNSASANSTIKIMDGLFRNYDKRIRPNFQEKPVEVTVSAYLLDIYDINEMSHQFTANMYLRHEWVDPRLTYEPPAGVDYLILEPSEMKKIWIPDTFIVNERKTSIHSFTTANEFLRLKPDGVVLKSTRATITASCIMNLKWFPFDRHTCTLNLESYGYNSKAIVYTLPSNKVGVSEETRSSIQFTIEAIRTNSTIISIGFSRAAIEIFIKRNPLRYLQDIFFPAIILPIVAFITMCTGSLQSRVHLSVIILAAMLIFQTMISTSMPKVSYQTALDFYVFNSSVMIFNVVITNFLVYHFLKPKETNDDKMPLTQVNGNADGGSTTDIPSDFRMGPPRISNRFHAILFKMFENNKYSMPIFFVIFNILYWPIVLIASDTFPEDFILLEDHNV